MNVQRPGRLTRAFIALLARPTQRIQIDYEPSRFPQPAYPRLDAPSILATNHNAVCRALYECGGWSRLYSRRIAPSVATPPRSALYSNLRALAIVFKWRLSFQIVGERIQQSAMFNALPSSERAHIWYFVGMAMPHLLLQTCGVVRWTMHHEWFRAAQGLPPARGPRPDLVGPLRSRPGSRARRAAWAVIEAKGSGGPGYGTAALSKAQAQTFRLGTRRAGLEVASSAHVRRGVLCMALVDPEPTTRISLPESVDDMVKEFYSPILRLLRQDLKSSQVEVRSRKSLVAYVEPLDLWLGVDAAVAELVAGPRADSTAIERVLDDIEKSQAIDHQHQDDVAMGTDGLVAVLGESWFDSEA